MDELLVPANIRLEDLTVMGRTVFGEAGGESRMGKVAVAWAIKNRVQLDINNDGKPDWWGEGIQGVCLKPMQFSCWNEGDPVHKRMMAARTFELRDCLLAAYGVLIGEEPDPTGGATHYFAEYIPTPKWARGKEQLMTVQIGVHKFYKGIF